MKKSAWLTITVIVVLIVIAFVAKNKNTGQVKIGVITALTGSSGVSTYGVPLKSGIDLALKEIDPKGTKYQLVYEDYALDTKQALPAYIKLKSEGIKIFIVDGTPAIGVVVPEIRKDGFLSFNTSSFTSAYKDNNPLTCRMALTSDNYGPVYADLLINKMHVNKVVALMPNFEAGVSLFDFFKKSFEALGGTILMEELYSKDATDFRTNIEKLKSYSKAQAIFTVNYFNSANTMFGQMKTLGLNLPIVTDDWTATLPNDKSLLNGAYFIGYTFSLSDPDSQKGQDFFNLYQQTYSTRPLINAVQSYDMMHILDKAINSVGTEPVKISDYLVSQMQPYDGVGGTISFNSDCEAQRDVHIGRIENGQIVK